MFFNNTIILILNNAIGMLTPFFIYPYISSVQSVSDFANVILYFSIIQFSNVLTDFGANTYVTKQVASLKCKNKISEFISNVLVSKVFISISISVGISVLIISGVFNDDSSSNFYLVIASIIVVQSLMPNWFFKGIEQMKGVLWITMVTRLLFFGSVVVFVDNNSNWSSIFYLYFISVFIALCVSLFLYFRIDFRLMLPSYKGVFFYFKNSYNFALSRSTLAFYGQGSVVFVGAMFTKENVVAYGVSYQLYNVVKTIFQPLSDALYPRMIKDKALSLWKKVFLIVCCCFIVAFIGYPLLGNWLLRQLYSPDIVIAIFPMLYIFIVIAFMSIVSSLIGYPLVGVFIGDKAVNRSVIMVLPLYVVAMFLLFLLVGDAYGIIMAVFITELGILLQRVSTVILEREKFR